MEKPSPLRRIGALAALLGIDTSRLESEIAEETQRIEEAKVRKFKEQASRLVNPKSLADATRKFYGVSKPEDLFQPFDYLVDGEVFHTSMLVAKSPSFRNFKVVGSSFHAPLPSDDTASNISLSNEARRALEPLARRVDVQARIDGTRIWDDPCFRLLSWGNFDRFDSHFGKCSFVDYRWTGGLLEDELKEAIVSCNGKIGDEILSSEFNKFRREWMPDLGSIVDLKNRLCCGGVSVLTAFNRGDHFLIPLQKRSVEVADGQGQMATIPKGLHQPLSSARENVEPYWTIMREFHEELYEGNVERPEKRLSHDWWLGGEDASATRHLVSSPSSHDVHGLGFGFNMVTGNYEYCCLLVIHEEDFLANFPPHGSWETADLVPLSSQENDLIKHYLTSDDGRLVNEALPSLVLGLQKLSQIAPEKVSLPSIMERDTS